jgi:hypothetical protein
MNKKEWEDGWGQDSNGYFIKILERGDRLIWHPSWKGNKHDSHVHLSASQAKDAWASDKSLRTWLKDNKLI